ncbi:MAG: SpoVR family protein [Armatimonadetes bacterium]|nr:SpoVR family protein [Armatimonadota bacterium]MDW8121319.1 SpoVR family protein [Armatimonadota bacterium]
MITTTELKHIQEEIEQIARDFGLDFYPVIFEVVGYQQMNALAAYEGFPVRYPHWRFGMAYEAARRAHAYGLQHIYEMVINNQPCYAYLLASNTLTENKMVIAHVYAHCDFFKNNQWVAPTNRKILDELANHAVLVERMMDRYGADRVEFFLDTCLSLKNLIDYHSLYIRRSRQDDREESQTPFPKVPKLPSKPYLDRWINPPDFLEEIRQIREKQKEKPRSFPPRPERDLLLFLILHAPIDDWQRDLLSIIREESYYFAPLQATKILNEGWATFWHRKIMTEKVLSDREVIDYADRHSSVTASSSGFLNPYKFGLALLEDIKERWDTGRFGKEYESCSDLVLKQNWDQKLGLGLQKLFEVRTVHNDVTFVDAFLTDEFVTKHRLFAYRFNPTTRAYEVETRDWQKVKERLVFLLTNNGHPIIWITDANYRNRSELYLWHQHEGVDLRWDYAVETLKRIHNLWKRPVHLESIKNRRRVRVSVLRDDTVQEEVL